MTGAVKQTLTVTAADLAKLPQARVTVKNEGIEVTHRADGNPLTRCTRRNENFVLVRSNRAITGALQNRRLALVTNIVSRASDGAVPVVGSDIKGGSRSVRVLSNLEVVQLRK